MSLATVIVPVYNTEKYLNKCVDSIIAQTYENIEIILVDDGSTDASGLICDEYKDKDSRIKVMHKKNGGPSDARNVALEVCKGEYIAFVDSDDYISPYFLETFIKEMEKGECDIVALKNATEFWDESGEEPELDQGNNYTVEYCTAKDALEKMLYQMIPIGAQFKVYRRMILEKIRFPIGYLAEDVATTYKAFLKASQSAIICGNLYAYRKRTGSLIRQEFNDKKLSAMAIFDQLINDEQLKAVGMEKAVASRVYAMLYSVFLQVPKEKTDTLKTIWKKLSTVQRIVMLDNSKLMRRKNKYAAWVSILGMRASYKIGRKYGQKGSLRH